MRPRTERPDIGRIVGALSGISHIQTALGAVTAGAELPCTRKPCTYSDPPCHVSAGARASGRLESAISVSIGAGMVTGVVVIGAGLVVSATAIGITMNVFQAVRR